MRNSFDLTMLKRLVLKNPFVSYWLVGMLLITLGPLIPFQPDDQRIWAMAVKLVGIFFVAPYYLMAYAMEEAVDIYMYAIVLSVLSVCVAADYILRRTIRYFQNKRIIE